MREGFIKHPAESMHVEGKDEVKESSELENYRREAQAVLDAHRNLFMSFGKDISLSYKLGNAFFIDLEKGEVNLATQWFAEKGFSREQILWAVLHELSHFRDLADDPERMMANFAHIRSRARETGAVMMHKWEEKYGVSDPAYIESLKYRRPVSKKNPTETMNAVEQAAYKMHHTFWNVFDDVFVNATVSRRAPAYERESAGGNEIERLYREKLFAGTDYHALPRHLQFLYAILRKEMVPGEEVDIGDDARLALEEKIPYLGKSLTAKEIVTAFVKPGKNKDVRAGERYFTLRRTLEPIFMKLLAKDLEDWDPEKPPEPEKQDGQGDGSSEPGDPNPFKQEYDKFSENSPDQMGEDQIEAWSDKREADKKDAEKKTAKAKADEQKTPEQKAADTQSAMDKAWCTEHGVSPDALQHFQRTEHEVAPYLDELSALWEKIIYGSGREAHRTMEGHFKTGTELDIQKVVDEWPSISKGRTDEVRVMKREIVKENVVRKPELIRVRVVADLSGSMDGDKKRILEQCVVLLLSSLREFNTKLNLTRAQTKSRLTVDTEAWAFGSSAEKIKGFREESEENEQVEIVRVFEKLAQSLGSTSDHLALSAIADSLTEEERNRVQSGKTMEIVFEITDGGADDPEASRRSIDRLSTDGMITRAFQIGTVSEDERKKFHHVWNDGREEPFGEAIGDKIANLTPAVVAALKAFLSGVRL